MTRLVLHFDINGTITPVDTTEPGNNIENANMVIAKSVFGKVINDKWILNEDLYDETNSMTYYDYLKSIDMQHYKKRSFTFTNVGKPGERLHYMISILQKSMHEFLFDSFLKVFDKYPDALIVFRTFGLDADEVIEYLRTNNKTSHKFKSIIKGQFSYDDDVVLTLENDEIVVGMDNINNLIKKSPSHLALKENYNYWNNNNRNKINGKQLLGDNEMVQIFFDDNDCVNIIDSKNCHFIKINTLHALLDNNYFVEYVDIITQTL